MLILKADCAKWKANLDSSNNPSLRRKFIKWKADNFTHISSLVNSVMHPISRIRVETHIAMIRMNELSSGFRVLSAETALMESLPNDTKQGIREVLLSNQTNQSERLWCVAMFEVESIDSTSFRTFFCGYSFGPYSNMVSIQEKAASENGRQVDLIQMLNKEL
jgi:hypothetical protein